jgi:sugar/nucleoside kinase (ribokinase family)
MKKRALFVGLTVVDIQYFVDEFPFPNQKIKTKPPLINIGGPAANAAITFSFLGGKSSFLTGIGKNSFASFIHEEFNKNNINVFDFSENECIEPVIATIVTSLKSSERSIISHYPCSFSCLKDLSYQIKWIDYDLVFIDGFYPEVALTVCKKARENNMQIVIVYDGGSWKSAAEEILPFVDIAICSEQFFPPGCSHFTEVIDYLHKKGINKIAITRGESSIQWFEGEDIKSIEVFKTDSIDSLGAGDIFHGAFSWYLMENINFESALIKASKVATFSTRFKGAREWMKHFNYLINL